MSPKTTGVFITSLRKEHNLTQKQLAEKLQVSDKAVSRWETGKGYPDIEFLMALSREFSVSINELLYGKRIENSAMAQTAQEDIAGAYIDTRSKKRIIAAVAAALAMALTVVILLFTIASVFVFGNIYTEVMGSESCVIAKDYSYITLFGKKYVPLVLDGVECSPAQCLIEEAQLEGECFLGKLMFGEKIYSVKQCANNEIIYLQTESGPMETLYYCLEEKAEEYLALSQQTAYDQLTAQIITKDWESCDVSLDPSIAQMLLDEEYHISPSVNCNWSRGEDDESIVVHSAQLNSPFIRLEGELLRKQGQYYWFDYDDIPPIQDNADYRNIPAYEIDDSFDEALDLLFSYMFQ